MFVVVVAGATATGKTEVALELARRAGGELVGADSVQVFRDFDIGSAKPTATELGGVPHHMLDVFDPTESVDAMRYAEVADAAIRDIAGRGRLPIVVGGTGLYLRALIRGLVDVPRVDPEIRSRLERECDEQGSRALHARLTAIDPQAAAKIHANDRTRIVRALEVFEQTGRPMGELRAEHALGGPRYPNWFFVLDLDRVAHRRAIETRVDAMLESGLIAEVARIRERWGDHVRPLGSVGYKEVLEHLRDGIPLEQTRRRMVKATWIYARRQRTWFASEPGIHGRVTSSSFFDDTKQFEAILAKQREEFIATQMLGSSSKE